MSGSDGRGTDGSSREGGAGAGDGPRVIGGLKACPAPLSEHYDAALLDLDGVVYLGGKPIPRAADALGEAASRGMKLAYVTNNASRSPNAIAAQLRGMGVPASAADIVTSAQAAAHLLADRLPAGSPVLVVGGSGLRLAVRERGLRPVTAAAERPLAVVQGFAPDISYGLLAEAALALRAGAFYVASNADATLPTPRGLAPGNGSLVQVLVTATGIQPVVAGKPEPPLHAESVERVGAKRPLIVGDRLDTDIEGAVRGGTDSLLVLTGVSSPAELLLAPPSQRPTYVARDLTGLNASHPDVVRGEGGTFSCGGWTAGAAAGRKAAAAGRKAAVGSGGAVSSGRAAAAAGAAGSEAAADRGGAAVEAGAAWLSVSGSGAWIDGLRALCDAAWAAGPPEGSPQDQRNAAERAVAGLGQPS